MNTKRSNRYAFLLFPLFLVCGCTKNITKNYKDDQDPGLSIFSNTQNNIMTCYANGKAWQTINRIERYNWGNTTGYEVTVFKQITSSPSDTLIITWRGHFSDESPDAFTGTLSLTIPVGKDFVESFNNLKGKRLAIDTTNGFFSTTISGVYNQDIKGSGNIFFLDANLSPTSPYGYTGNISGLLEADFGNNTITRGRFDHTLDAGNVRTY